MYRNMLGCIHFNSFAYETLKYIFLTITHQNLRYCHIHKQGYFNRKQEKTIFAATSSNSKLNHLKKLQKILLFTKKMLTKIQQSKRSKYVLKICFYSSRTMQPKDKITLTNFTGAFTLKLLENKSKL